MGRLRRSAFALISVVVLVLALAAWAVTPGVQVGAPLVALPWLVATGIVLLAMLALGRWVHRRRFYRVAGAILFALALAGAGAIVLGSVMTSSPSPLVALWTASVVMAGTVASTMRQQVWPWLIAGGFTLALFTATYIWLGHESWYDVLGGLIVGGLGASLANLIADVHVWRGRGRTDSTYAAAVIYNPVKVVGVPQFKQLVTQVLQEHGYGEPLWLETLKDDPGVAMAQEAINADVDRILIAGGDGTVRVVLGELTHTGMAAAILPSGTGNLLARNLSIPLDLEAAARLAVKEEPSPIDLIRVTMPDKVEHAAVLAGVGLDANIMEDTDEDLKRTLGVGAYIIAGARHIGAKPMDVMFKLDDGEWIDSDASLVSIGNVGELQKGVALMPEATASDGKLDVLVATPSSTLDVAQMISDVLTEVQDSPNITRYTGSKLIVRVRGGAAWQIDGDIVGRADEVTFETISDAVDLVIP